MGYIALVPLVQGSFFGVNGAVYLLKTRLYLPRLQAECSRPDENENCAEHENMLSKYLHFYSTCVVSYLSNLGLFCLERADIIPSQLRDSENEPATLLSLRSSSKCVQS